MNRRAQGSRYRRRATAAVGEAMATTSALLFGRRTWQVMTGAMPAPALRHRNHMVSTPSWAGARVRQPGRSRRAAAPTP